MSTCTISITVIKYDCVLHYQNIHSLRVPNNEVSSTPHPTPRPRVHPLLQIFGGWRLYSWVFLNEYTSIKNNNLTDTICMIDGTTRWGVSLTLSIMFRRRVFPIGLLLLILPAWHTYFYLGGRVHGWPRHKSLSHGASFRACTNVETPS